MGRGEPHQADDCNHHTIFLESKNSASAHVWCNTGQIHAQRALRNLSALGTSVWPSLVYMLCEGPFSSGSLWSVFSVAARTALAAGVLWHQIIYAYYMRLGCREHWWAHSWLSLNKSWLLLLGKWWCIWLLLVISTLDRCVFNQKYWVFWRVTNV